ncbi:DUF6545 domain-containing protein [Nocardia sp. CC227C]|uniref:DUF6545 domain-containing protein n=1 Tax=Nocardia sp. CC227C TaxID=3044562 RepID=UPI00278BB514|nr:DUF6545 domain-containing protein [Nocardia sp. CC227C]
MWPHDHMPLWATASATAFIVLITIIRVALTRHTSIFGHLTNTVIALNASAAVLREPVVARNLAGFVPGGLPTVFDAWHWLTLLSWACGLGMALVHEYGPTRYRCRFRVVIGLSVLVGLAFLALSHPARTQGMSSIANHGGWQFAVYFGLYTGLPAVITSYYFVLLYKGVLWRTTSRWERITVAAMVGLGLATLLPLGTIAAAGVLDVAGVDHAFHLTYTRVAGELVSGEAGLFVYAAVVVVFIPTSAQAVLRLLRLDQESRTVRRLSPIWRDLTAAAPQVVFRLKWADSWHISPRERLHRRRMEIHDAAEIVARYVRPLPDAVDELIDTTVAEADQEDMRLVAELVLAARYLADHGGEPPGEPTAYWADVPDERTLRRLWQPARSLALAPDYAHPVVAGRVSVGGG